MLPVCYVIDEVYRHVTNLHDSDSTLAKRRSFGDQFKNCGIDGAVRSFVEYLYALA